MTKPLWVLYITQETVCPTHLSSTSIFSSASPSILCACRLYLKKKTPLSLSLSLSLISSQLFLIFFHSHPTSACFPSNLFLSLPWNKVHISVWCLEHFLHILIVESQPCFFSQHLPLFFLVCLSLIPFLPLALFLFLPPSLIILIAFSSRSTASAFPSDAVYLISVPQGIYHMEQWSL